MESTPLSRAEQADEALLMGLRLAEGLDLDRLAALGGLQPKGATVRELPTLASSSAWRPAGCGRRARAASSSTRWCCGWPRP